jgi:hypothetical protein
MGREVEGDSGSIEWSQVEEVEGEIEEESEKDES